MWWIYEAAVAGSLCITKEHGAVLPFLSHEIADSESIEFFF